jgi:transposase
MMLRQVFSAMLYVLRAGCRWKALPRRFGSASTVHRHFLQWERMGFFLALWRAGLAEHDEMEGIRWEWQSIDDALAKAHRAIDRAGGQPGESGKTEAQAMFAGGRAWRPAVARRQRGWDEPTENSTGSAKSRSSSQES